jgi:energy-coupling factor transporter ATP-binding protein EcfA2
LQEVGGRLIRHLSKGYQQRVGIAQAIVHQPAVLVLDEPTVGLDPRQLFEVRQLVRALARDRAVIFSSHQLREVEHTCTRVVMLHGGRIVHESSLLQSAIVFQLRLREAGPQVAQALAPTLSEQSVAPVEVDTEMFERLDGGGRGRADGIGHIKAGKAAISFGQPDGRPYFAGICGTEGLWNVNFFLIEKGELSEDQFRIVVFSGDPLAWSVLDIGNFFQREIFRLGGFDDGFG